MGLKPNHLGPIQRLAPARSLGQARNMIWFYQRGDKHLFYEVRLSEDGPGFELGISYPEGTLLTERFMSEDALARRFAVLQASLAREGWGPIDRRPPESALQSHRFSGNALAC